jgi:hypothetical protein
MQLKPEDPVSQNSLIAVCKTHRQSTVHVVLNVIAPGNNHNFVPVVQLEERFEFGGGDQFFLRLFQFAVFPCSLLANQYNSPSFAGKSGDAWKRDCIADFVLVSADNPFVRDVALRDVF